MPEPSWWRDWRARDVKRTEERGMQTEDGSSFRGSDAEGEGGRGLFLLYFPESRGGGAHVDTGAEDRGVSSGSNTGGGSTMSCRLIAVFGVPGMEATSWPW